MSGAVFRTEEGARAVHRLYRAVLDRWPVPITELRVPTREGETFVIVCGSADAPPAMLLHGAQANAAAWMFDAALWSRTFRVYAVDMIGEAGFSAPVRPPLDGDAHALWLDDVMAGLGLSRAAFVGTSLGGWLALDYARRRPDSVERLALACPAGIGRQKNFLLRAAPLLLLGAWGRKRMREMVMGPAPAELPPTLRPFAELMGAIARVIRPRHVRIPRLTDADLQRLSMPVLAIVGGRDVMLDSFETRQRLERFAPHAEVRFLPDARHFIPGQATAILHFLACAAGRPQTPQPASRSDSQSTPRPIAEA
jgi:pimeloyl-ACP methyl ester carboxylesterase